MTCASCKHYDGSGGCLLKRAFINPADKACPSFALDTVLAGSTVEDEVDLGTEDAAPVYDDTTMQQEIMEILDRHQCTDGDRIRALLVLAMSLTQK